MPEHDEPEQELGAKITSAFQGKADAAIGLRANGLASEARRRVRKRRQTMVMAAAAVLVVVGIGGVWNAVGPTPSTTSSSAGSSDSKEGAHQPNILPTQGLVVACPPDHPILKGGVVLPAGTGLDVQTPVQGMQACRYRLTNGATMLLGQQRFNATVAQQVVDAIKVLPERNPELPVFKCPPQAAQPSEAIVLRFDTAAGIREVWVQYDGCDSAGFFTGSGTFGLYSAPLKLFMVGSVRPTEGTYLNALKDW
ncbi:hypothetical protein EV646_103559 [Kribbella antiqua]|uniref:Uncharacterized protein n=1 Tax=Kribbella antiqua TaxID=2512217 RepID=A0A4R2IWH9_9ACTN|nr:hypothetical protein [Kribbella antiqua]TCO49577.1 hypothetical protein EV646_103559 [Kribbella antiqua]